MAATATRFASADPDRTYARITSADPSRFYRGSGVIPAVSAVTPSAAGGSRGGWDRAGHVRAVAFSDGGTVREVITHADPPRLFVYELDRFSRLLGWLVAAARSEWRFAASGDGTAVAWQYRFVARRGRGLIVAAIVRWAWRPYMERVLAALIAEAERTP